MRNHDCRGVVDSHMIALSATLCGPLTTGKGTIAETT